MNKTLIALINKWKERKAKYYEQHGDCYGVDKTYNAGLSDELQTCILELEEQMK